MTISPIIRLRVPYRGSGWNPRAGSSPVVVSLEFQAEFVIENPQVSIPAEARGACGIWQDAHQPQRVGAFVTLDLCRGDLPQSAIRREHIRRCGFAVMFTSRLLPPLSNSK